MIIGWELLEQFILPNICCREFWLETPLNIFSDILFALLAYKFSIGYPKQIKKK